MIKINFSDIDYPNRIPTRPIDLQQENFTQYFDYTTFIYDIFRNDKKTYIISPPSVNEAWSKFKEITLFDDKPISSYISNFYTNKIQKLIIEKPIEKIRIKDRTYEIPKINGKLENKIVLYTLQKNNDIDWIIYWANWYVDHHNVTDIVIYDNNSDIYSFSELKNKLNKIKTKVYLESVDYLYGMFAYKGSKWDADFLQYAMFEHVRYYYLNNNGILINSDIDEIVVGNNISITDLVEENVLLSYHGKWVYTKEEKLKKYHDDHNLIDQNSFYNNKWSILLKNTDDAVFLRVHHADNIKKKYSKDLVFLHHFFINAKMHWSGRRYEGGLLFPINLECYDPKNPILSSYGETKDKIPDWLLN